MTGTDDEDRRVRYTIMPEHGGACGWINRGGADNLGPNHADITAWGGDHPIPDDLHAAFAAWQVEFEGAPCTSAPSKQDRGSDAAAPPTAHFTPRNLATSRGGTGSAWLPQLPRT